MKYLLTIIIFYVLFTLTQAWSLPICSGSPSYEGSVYWDNCLGTYNFTNGNKYVGEFKDNKRYGQGTFIWADGEKYVGEFKDNMFHGKGTYTFANGTKYVGEFKDNERNGQGVYTFGPGNWEGDQYVGEFKDDRRHGQGIYTHADGRVWQGQWKNGEWVRGKKYAAGEYDSFSQGSSLPICLGSPSYEGSVYWDNCLGTYIWSNGDKYVGEYKDNKYNGQGTFTWVNGDKYVGEFKDDLLHGQGTATWANGEKYVGEFKDDQRYGQGVNSWPNGNKYVGEFKNDMFHGQGVYSFGNGEWEGDEYAGEFKDDKIHGQGVYSFGKGEWEGDKYAGEFKDDKRHGQGIYTHADGRVWQGQWKNDEWVRGKKYAAGEYDSFSQGSSLPICPGSPSYEGTDYWNDCVGTYIFASGNKYVGEVKDNKRHGKGAFTWVNGDKYIGEYKHNMMHGEGTMTWANGEKYVGEFKDDKRHGKGVYVFADGIVWQGQWRDGEWVTGEKYAKDENNSPVEENNRKEYTNPDEIINAASGSGFIVSSLGHIVTNNHVIKDCNEVKVHHNGEEYKASIISKDDYNDLALLKATFTPSTILAIKNGNADLMEDIYVAGYPFGDFFNSSVKITKGIVSSLSGFQNNFSNMQIDAALQPGNSGGPVIDYQGNVVGVAVAKLDMIKFVELFNSVPENTNFAIKSSVLLNFLNSNGIKTKKASVQKISRSELSKNIIKGTLYLSCWMTSAKIEELRSKKVMFENIK